MDGVLENALEQRGQLGGALVAVLFSKLDHGVLDDVQGCLVVTYRKDGLLEGAPLDAGEKIGEFLIGGHAGEMRGRRLNADGCAAYGLRHVQNGAILAKNRCP